MLPGVGTREWAWTLRFTRLKKRRKAPRVVAASAEEAIERVKNDLFFDLANLEDYGYSVKVIVEPVNGGDEAALKALMPAIGQYTLTRGIESDMRGHVLVGLVRAWLHTRSPDMAVTVHPAQVAKRLGFPDSVIHRSLGGLKLAEVIEVQKVPARPFGRVRITFVDPALVQILKGT